MARLLKDAIKAIQDFVENNSDYKLLVIDAGDPVYGKIPECSIDFEKRTPKAEMILTVSWFEDTPNPALLCTLRIMARGQSKTQLIGWDACTGANSKEIQDFLGKYETLANEKIEIMELEKGDERE